MNKTQKENVKTLPNRSSFLVKILLGLTASFALLILCFSVFVFLFLNSSYSDKYLKYYIESRTGKKIICQDFSLSWPTFQNINILLKDLRVYEAERNITVFQAKEMDCELDLGSLFLGRLLLNKASAIQPVLFLKPESDAENNILMEKDQIFNILGLQLEIKNLQIHQATIVNLSHAGIPARREEILFNKLDAKFSSVSLSQVDAFEIKGQANESRSQGEFEIKGRFSQSTTEHLDNSKFFNAKFSDCPLKPFLMIFRQLGLNIPITGANLSFAADADFNSGKWLFKGVSIISGGFLQSNELVKSRVSIEKIGSRFSGELSDESIRLDLQEVNLPGAVASLTILIKNRLNTNPKIELSIKRAEIYLDRISAFIPLSLFPAPERDRIKKADLKGHIQIVNSYWSNDLNSLRNGNLYSEDMSVDAVLDGVSGFIPGFSSPIREASGFMRLNAKEVLFKGITLFLGNSQVVINGWISNLKTKPAVDLFVASHAYASDIRDVLLNRPFSQRFESIVKNIQDPLGSAVINMDVKGLLSNPSLKGRISLEDLQFKVDGLPVPIKKVVGDVRFRGSKINLSGLKGFIGDSPFEFRGGLSQTEWNLNFDFKLGAGDVRKFGLFPNGWNISGSCPITVGLKGSPSNLNFNGAIDLTPTKITFESFLRKKIGIPANVEFSGTKNSGGISIEEAYLVSEAGRISARGFFKDDGKVMVTINLPPKGIPTSALIPFSDPILDLHSGGRIEGDFSLRKEKNQEPIIEANINFSHITLRLPRFRKITEGLTGAYQRRSRFSNVTVERSRTGSSLISGSFSIAEPDNPKLKFLIDSEFLDTTDFTAPPGEINSISWQEWIRTNPLIRFLARSKLSGNVHVAKGKTELRTFDDFRADMEGTSGLIKVSKWQMNLADGVLRGNANFDIQPQTLIPLKINFHGEKLKFDRIFISDPQRVKVDGDMNVQGNMEWKIRPVSDNHGVYKTGVMDVVLTNGIIYRFEILSKIFSLINLGSLVRGRIPDIIGQGLPYQKITWKTQIFDNKWQFKDLKLFSDAAKVDASGMYFSDQNRIDFKILVSPLVGLDAIVSGLFGNLITKDGKILTTTFRVRGLYSSPDIRLEPFENLKMEN
ncbi:MAG: AsmA-like C-terminal domain-containing protein [Desulfomonilaceae bacterium]